MPGHAAVIVHHGSVPDIVRPINHLLSDRRLWASIVLATHEVEDPNSVALAFDVDVDPSIAVVAARDDLEEIAGNVLDNACKWARSRCRVTAHRSDGRVRLFVEDDGPGISAAMREQVLARGARADEAVPGSGLGLSIVRDLTDAYGGQVTLDDSSMGGVRVTIDLPMATAADAGS
jgi:signal transduction histidine kinase